MHSTLVVLLLSAAAISAAVSSDFKPSPRYHPTLGLHPYQPKHKIGITVKDITTTPEFNDVVQYLEYNLSPSDIEEMLQTLPEAFNAVESADDDEELAAEPRSMGSAIPWGKITDALRKMSKNNSKFTKVLNLVTDQKFRDLVKRAVNSHTLAEFVKGVAEHGFSWTEFLHLMLHALCSTATTIQHDKYSVGVCQVLQNI
ncbi:uncharacterized protein LOC129951415 [Eupeodes corollae]|uniref:uncharacterized protein LOC129951415 n=1 Tax=Eupeodes corollae TaxID=290404 RepID=UPI00248F8F65|nr:uncharacterized protein LOC129951415 [Eupeodes corollae]